MTPTAIYIHVPFCHSKCAYCDFFSIANLRHKDEYVQSLCKEILLRAPRTQKPTPVTTLYFGGGTPSILNIQDLSSIFHALLTHFDFSTLSEFTIECNPEDITQRFISDFDALLTSLPQVFRQSLRFSLGVQSFNDTALRLFRRRHTASQSVTAMRLLQDAGVKNISVDLIIAYPSQTISDLQQDLSLLLSLKAQHISTYILSFETGTPLTRQLNLNKISALPDTLVENMYLTVARTLTSSGYEHYEISNFALPGFHSKHNSAYWTCDIPYLGFGPSAHSYDGKNSRTANVSNLTQYIYGIQSNAPIISEDNLTEENKFDEYLMTHLRTRQGIVLKNLSERFGQDKVDYLLAQAHPYISSGKMLLSDNQLHLTLSGIMTSDTIIANLMLSVNA